MPQTYQARRRAQDAEDEATRRETDHGDSQLYKY